MGLSGEGIPGGRGNDGESPLGGHCKLDRSEWQDLEKLLSAMQDGLQVTGEADCIRYYVIIIYIFIQFISCLSALQKVVPKAVYINLSIYKSENPESLVD